MQIIVELVIVVISNGVMEAGLLEHRSIGNLVLCHWGPEWGNGTWAIRYWALTTRVASLYCTIVVLYQTNEWFQVQTIVAMWLCGKQWHSLNTHDDARATRSKTTRLWSVVFWTRVYNAFGNEVDLTSCQFPMRCTVVARCANHP